ALSVKTALVCGLLPLAVAAVLFGALLSFPVVLVHFFLKLHHLFFEGFKVVVILILSLTLPHAFYFGNVHNPSIKIFGALVLVTIFFNNFFEFFFAFLRVSKILEGLQCACMPERMLIALVAAEPDARAGKDAAAGEISPGFEPVRPLSGAVEADG